MNSQLDEKVLEKQPCRYGLMTFFAADTLISRSLREYGEWAQHEIDFLLRLVSPGDTVIDVGAFIGTHALAFSSQIGDHGHVHAFEPRSAFHEVLVRNIRENNRENVVTHNCAVSDHEEHVEVGLIDVSFAGNFGGSSLSGREGQEAPDSRGETVHTCTLDRLQLPQCTLIKIDAEGMELNVLRGARQTLRTTNPILFVECNSLQSGWPVLQFLRDEEYRGFFVSASAYNPHNYKGNPENIFDSARETAFLFMPANRTRDLNEPIGTPGLELVQIDDTTSIDGLALALLKKPQYKYEVLATTGVAAEIGNEFWANEPELRDVQSALQNERMLLSERALAQTQQSQCRLYLPQPYGYSEAGSLCATIFFGEWAVLQFALPDSLPEGELRLDPADCPCVVLFDYIAIESEAGEALWSARAVSDFAKLRVAGTAATAATNSAYTYIGYGSDCQLFIPTACGLSRPSKLTVRLKVDVAATSYLEGVKALAVGATAALSRAESQLVELRSELTQAQSERTLMMIEISRLGDEKISLQRQREYADSVASGLTQQLSAARGTFDQEHAIRMAMQTSRSWRLTEPMRGLIGHLRSFRRKLFSYQ